MSLVQLAGVSKIYRSLKGSDYVAVRDFSLEIREGEFFCLLGTSGCGKTTVLNMVAGFEKAPCGCWPCCPFEKHNSKRRLAGSMS